MKEIYLAGGCFWGVQEYFSRMDGILDTQVGYSDGDTDNPTYEEVCTGRTGHVETTYIKYDENIITLDEILDAFWHVIDPISINKQGDDEGSQYATGIYYKDIEDEKIILESLEEEQKKYTDKITTRVGKINNYYKAEEEHQDYLKKNPDGYCHIPLD